MARKGAAVSAVRLSLKTVGLDEHLKFRLHMKRHLFWVSQIVWIRQLLFLACFLNGFPRKSPFCLNLFQFAEFRLVLSNKEFLLSKTPFHIFLELLYLLAFTNISKIIKFMFVSVFIIRYYMWVWAVYSGEKHLFCDRQTRISARFSASHMVSGTLPGVIPQCKARNKC